MQYQMREAVLLFGKIFLLGAGIQFTVASLNGWSGADLYWDAFSTGVLSTLLWWVNGFISNRVTISWIAFPVRRFLVTLTLTIIGTLGVALLTYWLVILLRYGQFPNRIFVGGTGFYWSVLIITLFISLFMHGREFLMNYRDSIVEREELKRAGLASRFESLQNQVNPHFLFNSLNVLSNLVYKDADLSARFIHQLSQVYRYVLECRDQEVVPLSRELKMLDAYLFLLEIRFGKQLNVTVDLVPSNEDQIAPLSLQMLVENAVKHNVVSKRYPLDIKIFAQNGCIHVVNDLQPKQQEHDSLGVGLQNIKERYRFLSNKEVVVEKRKDFFSVQLPIIKM